MLSFASKVYLFLNNFPTDIIAFSTLVSIVKTLRNTMSPTLFTTVSAEMPLITSLEILLTLVIYGSSVLETICWLAPVSTMNCTNFCL
eukprot:snap_masked-scaffold_20-processed-gene-5.71-mRNA-1 protein AED:1.00 eAED:1.00 QI:0/0/0/0/1/1/2/0/87